MLDERIEVLGNPDFLMPDIQDGFAINKSLFFEFFRSSKDCSRVTFWIVSTHI